MSSLSDFAENALLNHVFGGSSYTRPGTVYLELFTAAPNFETGSGGTAVTGGTYARTAITNNTTNFPNASGSSKSNGAAITITSSADWAATVVAFGIYDASSAGNLLCGANFTQSKVVNLGDPVSIAISGLTLSLNTGFSTYLNNQILNHLLGGPDYTRPANLFFELFTAAPSFSTGSGGAAVSGGTYARLSITNNATNFPAASAGAKSNGADFQFTASSDWSATVTSFGIYDASSAGNFLGGANLTASKTVNLTDPVKFASGALALSLA